MSTPPLSRELFILKLLYTLHSQIEVGCVEPTAMDHGLERPSRLKTMDALNSVTLSRFVTLVKFSDDFQVWSGQW